MQQAFIQILLRNKVQQNVDYETNLHFSTLNWPYYQLKKQIIVKKNIDLRSR